MIRAIIYILVILGGFQLMTAPSAVVPVHVNGANSLKKPHHNIATL